MLSAWLWARLLIVLACAAHVTGCAQGPEPSVDRLVHDGPRTDPPRVAFAFDSARRLVRFRLRDGVILDQAGDLPPPGDPEQLAVTSSDDAYVVRRRDGTLRLFRHALEADRIGAAVRLAASDGDMRIVALRDALAVFERDRTERYRMFDERGTTLPIDMRFPEVAWARDGDGPGDVQSIAALIGDALHWVTEDGELLERVRVHDPGEALAPHGDGLISMRLDAGVLWVTLHTRDGAVAWRVHRDLALDVERSYLPPSATPPSATPSSATPRSATRWMDSGRVEALVRMPRSLDTTSERYALAVSEPDAIVIVDIGARLRTAHLSTSIPVRAVCAPDHDSVLVADDDGARLLRVGYDEEGLAATYVEGFDGSALRSPLACPRG